MAQTISPRWKEHARTSAFRTIPDHESPPGTPCEGSRRPLRNIQPTFAPLVGQTGFEGICSVCETSARYSPRISKWIIQTDRTSS